MKYDLFAMLSSYVDSLYPIIYVNHFDPHILDGALRKTAGEKTKIEVFDNALGCLDFESRTPLVSLNDLDLSSFLENERTEGFDRQMFFILVDVHESLKDPKVIALLKRIAVDNMNLDKYNTTVFIISPKLVIPIELERYITVIDPPLPQETEITDIIKNFGKTNDIEIADDVVREFAVYFKGLDFFQINQILNLAYNDGGNIELSDKSLIKQEKEQIIKKSGMLEYVKTYSSTDEIGGLECLIDYLKEKAKIIKGIGKAKKYGVDVPKGILILGMPGCGKSLAAKATATLFDVPLVRLDVGRLLGKYVGESEENMSRALKLAEAICPCVLWIDEIEKAFSGVGESGGSSDVTTRLFGHFLTWMQEKNDTVYIVATANDISKIPLEFLRKGRFDELFFTQLPNEDERRNILKIHLEKRKKLNIGISLYKVASDEITEGCNGADLEGIVKEAIESAFKDGEREITTEDLLQARKNTESITELMSPKLKELEKKSEEMNFRPANKRD